MTTKAKKTYYGISSEQLGVGPLHPTRRDALEERRDLLVDNPTDKISIYEASMTEEEYENLGEFPGY